MADSDAESIVTACLDALEARDFEQLRTYLSDTRFSYRSPVSATDDADTFINLVSRVGPILESIERIRTFVDGNDVCSILKLRTTMEALKEVPVVQLTTVAEGKIVAMEVFFDASEYNKMFDVETRD
jgi:limonene-1,2-epoxide hydrolase